jgi:hypothetical protein
MLATADTTPRSSTLSDGHKISEDEANLIDPSDAEVASAPVRTGLDTGSESYEMDHLMESFVRVPTDVANVASSLRIDDLEPLIPKATGANDGSCSSSLHHSRYASKAGLSKFIPECDPDHHRARTCRVIRSRRIVMLALQATLAFLVFFVNLSITVWVTKKYPASDGVGTLLTGNCVRVKQMNTGLHLVLNLLSTLFLGAGNYCMQVLVAPSGEELRKSHSAGSYYDIGIHSIHNLRQIGRGRRLLWIGFGICSTLLHLM